MAVSTLGKLQIQVDQLSKKVTKLRNQNAELKADNYQLRKRLERKDD